MWHQIDFSFLQLHMVIKTNYQSSWCQSVVLFLTKHDSITLPVSGVKQGDNKMKWCNRNQLNILHDTHTYNQTLLYTHVRRHIVVHTYTLTHTYGYKHTLTLSPIHDTCSYLRSFVHLSGLVCSSSQNLWKMSFTSHKKHILILQSNQITKRLPQPMLNNIKTTHSFVLFIK